jgi:hypothetical protein
MHRVYCSVVELHVPRSETERRQCEGGLRVNPPPARCCATSSAPPPWLVASRHSSDSGSVSTATVPPRYAPLNDDAHTTVGAMLQALLRDRWPQHVAQQPGTEAPVPEMAPLCWDLRARGLGLSVSLATRGSTTSSGIRRLRERRPMRITLLVDGEGAPRRLPKGAERIGDLRELDAWARRALDYSAGSR